ncbi:MAG: translation initiation factor IF-2 [Planctomycetota bacterium]
MRLHELAKEIGAESKALLKLAKELGLKIRNHSSNLAAGEVAILKAAHREESSETEASEESAEEEVAVSAAPARKKRRRKKTAATGGAQEDESADEELPEPQFIEFFQEEDESPESDQQADFGEDIEEEAAAAEPEPESESEPEPGVEPGEEAEPLPEPESEPESRKPGSEVEAGPVSGPETGRAPVLTALETEPSAELEPLAPAARRGSPTEPGDVLRESSKKPGRGRVLQVPTPRRRVPTGAKIVGRIELPEEEINKPRGPHPSPESTETVSPHDPLASEPGYTSSGRYGKAGVGAPERDAAEKRRAASRLKGDGGSWSPDEEDDPLLQGIRIRNIQTGPHTRRPPRRVGPRRSGRRVPAPVPTGPVDVQVPITVRDLSQELGVKANVILRVLKGLGIQATGNLALDEEGVLEVATSLNREIRLTTEKGKEDRFLDEVKLSDAAHAVEAGEDGGELRAPVVAFLGHVDHGKTSLLDRIRSANVAAGEAGGITQSMRAYSVPSPSGVGLITFLDTPGHKAFTEMRARGANTTDIVVLVVAADDGVMPQTEEAIQHAKAAEVPIVVALNKIDRHEADPTRVLQQLAQAGVMVEGWGGDVQVAKVSAVTGEGMDDLLDKISLQAEIMDLRADPTREAQGTVIESYKDDCLGAVATVLVQEGTLRTGDIVLSGTAYGRVRTLINDQGDKIDEAGPSIPVNIVGLGEAPLASERFYVVENLRQARDVAEEREQRARLERVSGPAPSGSITLENLFASLEAGKAEEIKVVLRCDVQGSLEVLRRSLSELETPEVKVKTIREALGAVTEDDVLLALASGGIVIGFNVIADEKARSLADSKGVEIRSYQVIYQLIDDVKAAMEGVLSPIKTEIVVGHVEIREVFKVSRVGSIAGCRVMDGVIRRNSLIRLSRDGRVIHSGKLDSLKRFKDDVREVKDGLECGLKLAGYDDIKNGDIVEVVEVQEEKRKLDFDEF